MVAIRIFNSTGFLVCEFEERDCFSVIIRIAEVDVSPKAFYIRWEVNVLSPVVVSVTVSCEVVVPITLPDGQYSISQTDVLVRNVSS